MSTSRHNHIAQPFNTKAEDKPCCYCGKPRPAGRRRWCSDACVDDFRVRKGDAGHIRFLLRQRDKEICAKCGCDMGRLRRVLVAAFGPKWDRLYSNNSTLFRWFLRRLGIPAWRDQFWDGDHIVPVVEGGGGCGLDGYRTLCIWCHRDETAALAKRRAQSRQDAKRPLLMIEK